MLKFASESLERFPAELHMVHFSQKYDNFTEASKHSDGLAVLAVLIEVCIVEDIAKLYVRNYIKKSLISDGEER